MSERYRYGQRPRSPTYNPARASLPINLSGFGHPAAHEHHLHAVPTSRREVPTTHTRTGSSTAANVGTVMTTYKIKADPPPRSTSAQNNHSQTRRRSATIDNSPRPAVVTTISRHKPVIHSGGGRPASPMKNLYRSSEEEFYTVPGNSQHSHSHHKRYSTGMDNGELGRTGSERGENRLRIGSGRQEAAYRSSRPRATYPTPVARRTDPVGGSYGDDEYGYTNPRELVQYDLNQPARRHQPRRDSFEANKTSRPTSISGYADISPRAYDARDRGPPPTTRGFDRIPRGATWEQSPSARMPAVPPPPMMDPVQRLGRIDPYEEPTPPVRRNSLTRPVSLYHDRDRERMRSREYDVRDAEPYTVRDAEPRHRRDSAHRMEQPRFDSPVEQRGFGIRDEVPPPRPERVDRLDRVDRPERVDRIERPERVDRVERPDRVDRVDRPERPDRVDRVDRSDRADRSDRYDRYDRPERSERPERPERGERADRSDEDREHKSSRDLLTTGLGLAGAALGIKTLKNVKDESRDGREKDRESREDREERSRREYDDEPRRRREKEDRRPEPSGREPRERRDRDDDRERTPPQPPRDTSQTRREVPVQPREAPPPRRDSPPRADRELRESNSDPVFLDLSGRNPQERPASRTERPTSKDSRESEEERRERRRLRAEGPPGGNDSRSGSGSEAVGGGGGFHHPRPIIKDEAAAPAPFNPKDTMDLKALKEALNSKENSAPPREEAAPAPRNARVSATRTSADAAQIRSDLNGERRSRERLASIDNQQPRVVSPPRPKADKAPVKGILRQPKEKFPEDPSPIREGVAPLKDAKKDGVPPDARWTKISRKLVNPEALELGKERYEARDDFVIVLRVLSRDEVQGYAEVTQKLRGMSY
jgi:hypothetical protein